MMAGVATEVVTSMERKIVKSSNVKSVGYDPEKRLLEVEFANGGVYQYEDVDQRAYEETLDAKSIGSYIHAHIKSKHNFKKSESAGSAIKVAAKAAPSSWTNECLAELLQFIQGKLLPHLGTGITTYPTGDQRNRALHDGCLVLERCGLIRRFRDESDYVIWEPRATDAS